MAQHFLLSSRAKTLSFAQVFRLTDAEAEAMFRQVRWPETEGAPVCPKCGGIDAYECRRPSGALRFRCKACKGDYSITSGTLFDNHKLPLRMYLAAIAVFCNEVKGKSMVAMSRDLGLAYKSAFVLCHKMREAMAEEMKGRMIGDDHDEASVDGAYFGGHEIRRSFALEIGTQIISPLLALLDGPLSNQAYSVHDSIYATESELIELVAAKVDPLLPEILSRYLANGDLAELRAILEAELSIEGVRSALTEYFEKYMAADAFLEFRDLETYAATGENLQLYIYIGTLKYGNSNFPLFYAPVEATRDANTGIYSFGLVSHLYANIQEALWARPGQ